MAIRHKWAVLMSIFLDSKSNSALEGISNSTNSVPMILVASEAEPDIDVQGVFTQLEILFKRGRVAGISGSDSLNSDAHINRG